MTRLSGTVPLLLLPLALQGQNAPRFVVDSNVGCHARPTVDSPTSGALPLGREIAATWKVQNNGTTWYLEGSCWVYGPGTEELNPASTGTLQVAILNHILARKEVKLEECVEVENYLRESADWPSESMPGLVRFRWFQVVDRALADARMHDDDAAVMSFERAWAHRQSEFVVYYEPDAAWFVDPSQYWNLFDANRNEPWAEELAWAAARLPIHSDDCHNDCKLDNIRERPLEYWTRYPAGPHVKDALSDGAVWARAAAVGACVRGDPGSEVDPNGVDEIRTSLANVTDPGKTPILESLDDISRKCAFK